MPATANKVPFWRDLTAAVDSVHLLQQAVFPASSVHMKETTVSTLADELRLAHDMLSGDTEFLDADDVEAEQMWKFAEAFRDGSAPPQLSFNVDDILTGERNAWLPDLHVSANMSFAMFAPGFRSDRDAAGAELNELALHWAEAKPSFEAVLEHELGSYGAGRTSRFLNAVARLERAMQEADADPLELVEASNSQVLRQVTQLREFFERAGVPSERSAVAVGEFWRWPGNREQPTHRISAYLFAAMARKTVAGKRSPPGRGALNDITAIATYAPYVDAMFVDNEFAAYLREHPLRTQLGLSDKVYSVRTGADFIAYLEGLSAAAPDQVREYAGQIYGVK